MSYFFLKLSPFILGFALWFPDFPSEFSLEKKNMLHYHNALRHLCRVNMADDTRVRERIQLQTVDFQDPFYWQSLSWYFQVICCNLAIVLPLFFLVYYMTAALLSGAFKWVNCKNFAFWVILAVPILRLLSKCVWFLLSSYFNI